MQTTYGIVCILNISIQNNECLTNLLNALFQEVRTKKGNLY
jgi:hypothetical protein